MPTDTEEDWATIARRLGKVPTALEQWVGATRARRGRGPVRSPPPGPRLHRPVRRSSRPTTASSPASSPGPGPVDADPEPGLRSRPRRRASTQAAAAYGQLGDQLRDRLLDRAPECGCRRAGSATSSPPGPSSARPSTSTRPTPGARRRWPGSPPRWRRSPTGSGPARRVKEAIAAPRRRPGLPARRHRRPQGLDAGAGRRGHRAPLRDPLRHPRAGAPHRVPHRPDEHRRHLLHRPERRLQPARPDVVVGPEGGHPVRHLARADHRLPRGRPRASPPGRPDDLPPRDPQQVPPDDVVDLRLRRGVGPVRRAAHGRARATWTTPATGWACSTRSRCGPPGSSSTSASTAGCRPRPRSAAAPGTTTRPGRSSPPTPTWTRRPCASSSTATSAGRARRRATRSVSGCGCSCATRSPGARATPSTLRAFHRRALDIGSVGLDTLRSAVLG